MPIPCEALPPVLLCGLTIGCVDLDERVGGLAWPSPEWCAPPRSETVACTLDGDTVDVGACGQAAGERIRLLGVAAPEIAHGGQAAECYGDEASAFLDELLTGLQVQLEFDRQCSDVYGRTLSWLFLDGNDADRLRLLADIDNLGIHDDGTFHLLVNEWVIRLGFGTVYRADFADDIRFIDRLGAAEQRAAAEGRGLWSACGE